MAFYRNRSDLFLGSALIAILLLAQVALMVARARGLSMSEGMGAVAIGLYLFYVAGVMFASYLYKESTFLFRWLVSTCARVAGVESDLAVVGFGGFAALAGLAAIVAGLT